METKMKAILAAATALIPFLVGCDSAHQAKTEAPKEEPAPSPLSPDAKDVPLPESETGGPTDKPKPAPPPFIDTMPGSEPPEPMDPRAPPPDQQLPHLDDVPPVSTPPQPI